MPYTKKETVMLQEMWKKGVPVERLCVKLNKTPKSIIAKLTNLGVYEAQGYKDKTGQTPVMKAQIVSEIESVLGVPLDGLEKAPKLTLKRLADVVCRDDIEIVLMKREMKK